MCERASMRSSVRGCGRDVHHELLDVVAVLDHRHGGLGARVDERGDLLDHRAMGCIGLGVVQQPRHQRVLHPQQLVRRLLWRQRRPLLPDHPLPRWGHPAFCRAVPRCWVAGGLRCQRPHRMFSCRVVVGGRVKG